MKITKPQGGKTNGNQKQIRSNSRIRISKA